MAKATLSINGIQYVLDIPDAVIVAEKLASAELYNSSYMIGREYVYIQDQDASTLWPTITIMPDAHYLIAKTAGKE